MKIVKITFCLAILSLITAFLSAFLFINGCDFAGAVGVFSTIISTILGAVSIVYTYVSGKQTIELLDKIKKQNENFVNKIQTELLIQNFDEDNINNLRKTPKNSK